LILHKRTLKGCRAQRNVRGAVGLPINGFIVHLGGDTTGWYIWAGERVFTWVQVLFPSAWQASANEWWPVVPEAT